MACDANDFCLGILETTSNSIKVWTHDSGAGGESGLSVTLYASDGTTVVATGTTGADYSYTFTGLTPGTTYVAVQTGRPDTAETITTLTDDPKVATESQWADLASRIKALGEGGITNLDLAGQPLSLITLKPGVYRIKTAPNGFYYFQAGDDADIIYGNGSDVQQTAAATESDSRFSTGGAEGQLLIVVGAGKVVTPGGNIQYLYENVVLINGYDLNAPIINTVQISYLYGTPEVFSDVQSVLDTKTNIWGQTADYSNMVSGAMDLGSSQINNLADGTSSTDAVALGQLDARVVSSGIAAPTTATIGSVGALYAYVESGTGHLAICTDDTGGTYTWQTLV